MAATMNSFISAREKLAEYIEECKSINISVLPPSINKSDIKFTVEGKDIRYPLAAINGVGMKACESIVFNRNEEGQFRSFTDFVTRINKSDVNKKCFEGFIKAGAFDGLGNNRCELFSCYEDVVDTINNQQKKNLEGQLSLFEILDDTDQFDYEIKRREEFDLSKKLIMEKEVLGLYMTGNPLDEYRGVLKDMNLFKCSCIKEDSESEEQQDLKLKDNERVKVAGIINSVQRKLTKNNDMMAFLQVEDLYGTIEVIVFPRTLDKYASVLVPEKKVIINGRISLKQETVKLIAEDICELDIKKDECINNDEINIDNMNGDNIGFETNFIDPNKKLYINGNNIDLSSFEAFVKYFSGNSSLIVVKNIDGSKMIRTMYYKNEPDIIMEMADMFGKENMAFK